MCPSNGLIKTRPTSSWRTLRISVSVSYLSFQLVITVSSFFFQLFHRKLLLGTFVRKSVLAMSDQLLEYRSMVWSVINNQKHDQHPNEEHCRSLFRWVLFKLLVWRFKLEIVKKSVFSIVYSNIGTLNLFEHWSK